MGSGCTIPDIMRLVEYYSLVSLSIDEIVIGVDIPANSRRIEDNLP